MLFEALLAGTILYFGAAGHTALDSARLAGRAVGRAAGALRRVRAAAARVQQRAEAVGGAELQGSRRDIADRLMQLRAIQEEAAALVRVPVGGGVSSASSAGAPTFSDAELAAATRGAGAGAGESAPVWGTAGAGGGSERGAEAAANGTKLVASYYIDGKPVVAAKFLDVWEAGSSVPRAGGAAGGGLGGVGGGALALPMAGGANAEEGGRGAPPLVDSAVEPLAQRLAALALEPAPPPRLR